MARRKKKKAKKVCKRGCVHVKGYTRRKPRKRRK